MLSGLAKTLNRHQWIAEAAYYKAEVRHFKPGRALNDWLEAEMAYSEMLITAYLEILQEDGTPLTVLGLQQLAALIGIDHPEDLISEVELIREIQQATNNPSCFRSDVNWGCNETECQWRAECRKLISVWYQ